MRSHRFNQLPGLDIFDARMLSKHNQDDDPELGRKLIGGGAGELAVGSEMYVEPVNSGSFDEGRWADDGGFEPEE